MNRKVLGISVLGILSLVLFYTHLYTPLAEKKTALSAEYMEKNRKLAEAKALAKSLPYLKERCALLKEQLLIAEKMLPTKEEIPSLLRQITLIGNRRNIDFLRFSPQEPESKEDYEKIPIEVAVRGKYHEIGVFLEEIGLLERIIIPSVEEITTAEEEEEGLEEGKKLREEVIANMQLTTFCFKE